MNRYRGQFSAPSKATSQTLCQKCLKRDDYECKATAQERPYISRPSRTQQLANPKLVPKLNSDIPNDLLRKTGIADEQLAKKEEERGRKRKAEESEVTDGSRKRSRSNSSNSSYSVSTISTRPSRSSSPRRPLEDHTGNSQLFSGLQVEGKRGRGRSTSMSYSSESSHTKKSRLQRDSLQRNGHERSRPRRKNELSLARKRDRQGGTYSRSRSMSDASDTSMSNRRRRNANDENRGKRRRHSSRSPINRGRNRDGHNDRGNRRTRSVSESRDRSEVTRNRKSMTPGHSSRPDKSFKRQDDYTPARRPEVYSKDSGRFGSGARNGDQYIGGTRHPPKSPVQRKERSLSPFSKRLALTQAMNMGR